MQIARSFAVKPFYFVKNVAAQRVSGHCVHEAFGSVCDGELYLNQARLVSAKRTGVRISAKNIPTSRNGTWLSIFGH